MNNSCHTIKLRDIIRDEFKKDGLDLVTRQTGQKIFTRLEKEINAVESSQTIVLDFSGVGVIDYSCADEVIAKLISRLQLNEYGDRYLALLNLTSTQKENIHVALERKNLAILGLDNGKSWHIVGVIDNYLFKTLEMIMQKGSLSSSELSEDLKLELNTASMRLINLHRLRLVKKMADVSLGRGRRHYVYSSVLT